MGGNSVSSAIGSSAGSTLLTGLSTLSLLNGKNSGKNQIEQLRQNTAADIQNAETCLNNSWPAAVPVSEVWELPAAPRLRR